MNRLNSWLNEATRHLSADSAAQVRTEIREHYDAAREAAAAAGLNADQADFRAVEALGDPKAANRQYRRVLLTKAEAKMLANSNGEARAFCARPWIKYVPLAAAGGLLVAGAVMASWALVAGALALAVCLGGPLLPVFTVSRSRVFRVFRWVALITVFAVSL